MTNQEIARVFKEIAEMLTMKKENWFKIRAYLKVVESIEKLEEPVEKLAAENRLREIPGVGEAIEKKIKDLIATGEIPLHKKLKDEFPEYRYHG